MLSDTLKKETQQAHDKLETNWFMQKLKAQTFNKEDYAKLLMLLYNFHYIIEPQLFDYEDLQMPLRERCSHLIKDLESLPCTKNYLKDYTSIDLELKIDTHSKALGALYVLEGSRMGGIFLSQMIRTRFKDEPSLLYFDGLKEQTPSHVQAFKAFLNERSSIINTQECIQSAKDTFGFIDYLFARFELQEKDI